MSRADPLAALWTGGTGSGSSPTRLERRRYARCPSLCPWGISDRLDWQPGPGLSLLGLDGPVREAVTPSFPASRARRSGGLGTTPDATAGSCGTLRSRRRGSRDQVDVAGHGGLEARAGDADVALVAAIGRHLDRLNAIARACLGYRLRREETCWTRTDTTGIDHRCGGVSSGTTSTSARTAGSSGWGTPRRRSARARPSTPSKPATCRATGRVDQAGERPHRLDLRQDHRVGDDSRPSTTCGGRTDRAGQQSAREPVSPVPRDRGHVIAMAAHRRSPVSIRGERASAAR